METTLLWQLFRSHNTKVLYQRTDNNATAGALPRLLCTFQPQWKIYIVLLPSNIYVPQSNQKLFSEYHQHLKQTASSQPRAQSLQVLQDSGVSRSCFLLHVIPPPFLILQFLSAHLLFTIKIKHQKIPPPKLTTLLLWATSILPMKKRRTIQQELNKDVAYCISYSHYYFT